MANMQNQKTPMPVRDAQERITHFHQVALGYTYAQMKAEADRCLQCVHHPCTQGCPVSVAIPEFIRALKEDQVDDAYDIITRTNSFPSICGRVCPQENQCEKYCVRGVRGEAVAIGRLERYAADHHQPHPPVRPQSNGIAVAIVGSGPAGLACASDLAQAGFEVTVFEALHEAGGVLRYGIPEFRLPKAIVDDQLQQLRQLGVRIETNVIIGKTITMDELMQEGFKAVFIGSGQTITLDCDSVVMALGTTSNPLLVSSEPRLKTDSRGCLIVDANQKTSMDRVYAGGDAVSGAATVILALGAGKKAAAAIIQALTES